MRSYFNLVNAQGGVNGHKLQLIDCDSEYDPSSAHQCAQKLISQRRARDRRLAVAVRRADRDEVPDGPGRPGHRRPRRACRVRIAAVVPDDAEPRHRGTALGTHAGQIGLKKPGVIFLNANFIRRSSRLAARRAEAAGHHAGRRRAGRRHQGRLHATSSLKFQAAGAQSVVAVPRPVLLRPPVPGDGAPELPSARPRLRARQGVGERAVRLRLWIGVRGRSAPTRRRRCSSPRPPEHAGDRAVPRAQCTRTSPISTARSTSYTTLPVGGGQGVRAGDQATSATAPVTPPDASSTRSTTSRTTTTAAHPADLLRLREPRPAALLPVDPQHERPVEDHVRLELLLRRCCTLASPTGVCFRATPSSGSRSAASTPWRRSASC